MEITRRTLFQNTIVKKNWNAQAWIREAGIVFAASLFLAVCSQIIIPLYPLPITLQTLAVLLIGATLGKKRGALAIALYLCEGAMGYPVFAGGSGSIASFMSPTAGYLVGFIPAAYIVGYLLEKFKRPTWLQTIFSLIIGNAVIFAVGLPWLSLWIGLASALQLGLYPFIVGDLFKVGIAAAYLRSQK